MCSEAYLDSLLECGHETVPRPDAALDLWVVDDEGEGQLVRLVVALFDHLVSWTTNLHGLFRLAHFLRGRRSSNDEKNEGKN
jgi:hypothetical protein